MVERMRQQFEIEAIQALTRAAPDFAAADAAGQAPLPQATPVLQRSTTTTAVGRRAAWARQQAPRVFQAVTQQLGRAELLQLGPDEAVTQHTSVLLLAGSLQCAPTFPEGCSDSGRDAVRWLCSAGKHRGQGLLPAMWEVLGREDVEAAPGERRGRLHWAGVAGQKGCHNRLLLGRPPGLKPSRGGAMRDPLLMLPAQGRSHTALGLVLAPSSAHHAAPLLNHRCPTQQRTSRGGSRA
jgi:hypothetical protein